MYISKIVIENFRNFDSCEVKLDKETANRLILIGETQSGKTNFLHALRLLLDPQKNRLLENIEILDFHNAKTAEKIKIAIELTSDSEHPLRGLLYDCYISHVISAE